ncbi:MAG TPA: DUF4402 domain-containing protein [Balneolaceae bacterium]
MKTSKLLLAAITLFAFAATANTASAQVSTTVQATGTVLEPITLSGTDLAFGTQLFPGIAKTITTTDAGAAQFDIDGEASKQITADFTLPTELTHTTDNTTTMSVDFTGTVAEYSTSSTPTGTNMHDPSTTLTTTLGSTSGLLYIWLGGTVSPTSTQKAGAYSGDITLTVAYTGN